MAGLFETDPLLDFALLGPLRVARAGAPVELGGRQQRAVLARLLMADGSGVSVDELADALWGERLPAGCASTIRTYVFHLRQALEPERVRGETGRLLVTDHGRYRLLSNGAIDADRFEQATTAGLRLLADGAASEAAAELDRGLRLWRGEVLSDLAGYDFIAPLAARLTDRRLTAVEAKVDAELALGRHSAVLPELEELIARYPLRERLHAQRMVALYRSGRASDALASYGQLRHHLADELGADPSPPLQRLHQQLLIHDPVLQIQPPSAEEVARQRSSETVRFRPHRIRRTARPRLRARWLVAGIVVAAGAAAGVGAIVVQEPQRTLAVIPPNSVAVIDASGGAMHDAIPVGQSPEGIAYGAGSVWVTNSGDNTVMRINPKTHEVIQTVLVGSNPVDIAVSDTRAWVANAGDGTVSEIDTNTSMPVGTPIPVGSLPGAIAADDNGAWVANSGDGTIQHIDARSGRAGSAVTVGEDPQGIALDGTSLWVSSAKSRVVSHLDARTGQPVGPPINVGAGAKGIAVADGSVWVANNADLTVTRIDRALGRATATMRVGDGPDAVAVGHGRVWVSDEYDGTVAEVDPTSQSVLHRYATGSSVHGMAVVGGSSVWVAAQSLSGNTHVGGTLVVGAAGLPGQFGGDLDPPTIYLNDEYAAMRPVYDSLLAYRAAGGSEGLTLVPDLATTVPEPTDGGRRYTFFVRKGIRYSDGRTVVASDFLRGLERALIVGEGYSPTDWYYGIVGGRRCHDAPRMCDLSGGVSVDDVSGRIAVQLTAPDDAFLYKFANLLVVPTPPGIPVTTLSPHRVPGTGPYQVQAFTPNKQLILTRNPYFRQWSFAAQPAGYPDRIVWSPARTTAAAVQDVLTGRADLTDLSLADTAVSDDVYRNYRDLVHRQTGFEFE